MSDKLESVFSEKLRMENGKWKMEKINPKMLLVKMSQIQIRLVKNKFYFSKKIKKHCIIYVCTMQYAVLLLNKELAIEQHFGI